MNNIRRFQRMMFTSFTGINAFVFARMEGYQLSQQLLITIVSVFACMALIFFFSQAKIQSRRKKSNL